MNNGIFLLLGTNQGNRKENLDTAKHFIVTSVGKIRQASAIYKTAAWGKPDQPEFFNQVIEIETALPAEQLLSVILEIEKQMGRKRVEKWGARIIDIDILFYHQSIITTPVLTLPHPGISERKFTLVPLREIAGDFHHPLLNKTIKILLSECTDKLPVEIYAPDQFPNPGKDKL